MSELPKGWRGTLLNGVVDKIVGGGTPSKSVPSYYEGDIPWMTVKDMNKSYLTDTIDHITQEAIDNSSTNVIPAGTPIIATRMSLGKIVRASFDSAINQDLKALFVNREVDDYYFEYWYRSQGLKIESLGTGTTVKGVRLEVINALEFPLAPLAEQKRIVEKLDEVLAQVDTIKARLDGIPGLLKRFRQSVLASAVSGKLTQEWRGEANHQISIDELLFSHRKRWEKSKLDDFKAKNKLPKSDKWKEKYKLPESVVDESVWLTPSNWCWASIDTIAFVTKLAGFEFTKFVKYVDEGTVPVIKAENVGKDGFKKTNFSLVPKSIVEALPRSEIYGGELLVTFVGAGVGQVCRVPSDRKYFLGPNVALARVLDTNVDERYIEFLFKSNGGFKNLLSQSKGAAQPSLSMTQIRQTSVPIPPLEEQQEIVRLVDQYFAFADTIEVQVKKAQARVDNLTQSILAKAFRGELVEQDPNDEPADKLLERIAQARKEAEALAKAAKKAQATKKSL